MPKLLQPVLCPGPFFQNLRFSVPQGFMVPFWTLILTEIIHSSIQGLVAASKVPELEEQYGLQEQFLSDNDDDRSWSDLKDSILANNSALPAKCKLVVLEWPYSLNFIWDSLAWLQGTDPSLCFNKNFLPFHDISILQVWLDVFYMFALSSWIICLQYVDDHSISRLPIFAFLNSSS